jgi:hypothetical protein
MCYNELSSKYGAPIADRVESEKMYSNIGVRQATESEIVIFKKVDSLLTDELASLVFDEDLSDLLKNKIKNQDLKRSIKALGLTIEEVCIWYFMT